MLTNNALHEAYLTLARHHVAIYPDQGELHLPEAERSWSPQEYRLRTRAEHSGSARAMPCWREDERVRIRRSAQGLPVPNS